MEDEEPPTIFFPIDVDARPRGELRDSVGCIRDLGAQLRAEVALGYLASLEVEDRAIAAQRAAGPFVIAEVANNLNLKVCWFDFQIESDLQRRHRNRLIGTDVGNRLGLRIEDLAVLSQKVEENLHVVRREVGIGIGDPRTRQRVASVDGIDSRREAALDLEVPSLSRVAALLVPARLLRRLILADDLRPGLA